ncbi:MAG: 30S ribosomal protein S17 [Patescibacteria group bacterium]
MKTFEGIIVSNAMNRTVVVEVTRKTPHPLYRKLIKRSKKYKVDTANFELAVGNKVRIVETKPISRNKFFKVSEIISTKEKIIVKKEAHEEITEIAADSAKDFAEPKKEKKPKAVRKTAKKENK